MARWKALAGALLFAALMAGSRGASAFCRSTTCDTPLSYAACDSTPSNCEPLAWKRSCVGWTIHKDGTKKIPREVVEDALNQAFLSWMSSTCEGGLLPGLEIQDMGEASCGQVEYNQSAGNANVIIFRDGTWPHEGGDHNIALTTVTYGRDTGEIYDADIEVNTKEFEFTWGDAQPAHYDLISVFTHEAGHFLGLSHSSYPEATMYRHYDEGTIGFRDLDIDDQNAMCAVYPPTSKKTACNPIPRHGFSPDCAANQTEGKCSMPAAPPPSGGGGAGAALAALALMARSARRARRARPRS